MMVQILTRSRNDTEKLQLDKEPKEYSPMLLVLKK